MKNNVWNDPWLCSPENSYVRTPLPNGLENLNVNDLLENSQVAWNYNLIHEIFLLIDAQNILAMPIFLDHS